MSIVTRLTGSERATVVQHLSDEATPRFSFYVLVLLATGIASYGLLQNSTAVVIGAMLIAPLMGPIYGIALGLIRNDRRLLLTSTLAEAAGIALAVGLALAIGLMRRPEFGAEVLARTKPDMERPCQNQLVGDAGLLFFNAVLSRPASMVESTQHRRWPSGYRDG